MTRHRLPGFTSLALWGLIASLLAAPIFASAEGGVVVEPEAKGALARGGIRAGDRVLSCQGSGLGWQVRTPFDLLECEWEIEPRGPVTLHVLRGDERLELTIPPGEWHATARPSSELADDDPWRLIDRADRLTKEKRFEDAGNEFRKVMAMARGGGSPRLELAALWAQRALLESRGAKAEIRLQNAEDMLRVAGSLDDRPLVGCLIRYHVGYHQTYTKRLDEARETFETALEIVRKVVPAGGHLEGRLVSYLGNVAMKSGDFETAARRTLKAVEILDPLRPESRIHAWTYGNLGLIEMRRNRSEPAIAAFERQIAISRALGNVANTLYPLHNLAIVIERMGDFPRADAILEEAMAVIASDSALQVSNIAAIVFGQRGYMYLSWGRLAEAAEYNAKAHRIIEQLGDRGLQLARSFARLGHVARYRGDLNTAEGHYMEALSIYEEIDNAHGVASHLSNLGNLARQRKDFETALALYSRSLKNMGSGGTGRPRTLSNLGRTYLLLGQPDQAAPFLEESLELKLELGPENLDVAASLMLLGDLERSRNDLDQAAARYRAALEVHSKLVPGRPAEAENQIRLGQLLLDRGDPAAAKPLLAQAVATTGLRAAGTNLEADALYHLARWHRGRGQIEQALDLYRRAVDALDVQWQKLGGSRDSRLTWMHAHADYYRAYLELLVERGQNEEAFDLLQRFRARGLRDILAQRDLDLPTDERARAIENQIVDLAREREALLRKLDAEAPEGGFESLRGSLSGIRSRRERLLAELRVAAPELARLKYPAALSLREVGAALDGGTVLISFAVGHDRALAFVLRRGDGGRPDLEVKRLPIGRDSLGEQVAAFRRSIERHDSGEVQAMQAGGARLYELLLTPLSDSLEDAERILIAPDGPLHALPFGALRREGRYLIEWKPVHLAPSATVHTELARQEALGRKAVAFGDPAFGSSGEGGHSVRGTALKQLPGTRREVAAFRRALPPPVETFVGHQATEARVKQLRDERLIHLASHGLVNQDLPLESALALARSESDAEENGLLHAWEVIEQMRLSTSLVTLSACETALGREVQGEGILGLVWAFHYAGAKSVIASLWNVEDRSTSDLMAGLYAGLASGLTKDDALRQAQLQQIEASSPTGRSAARGVGGLVPKDAMTTAHPFYWAAFQLYGSISH